MSTYPGRQYKPRRRIDLTADEQDQILNTYSKRKFTNTSFYHSPHLPKKHNHVEIQFNNLKLVYNDPRRFGYILFINSEKELLKKFEKPLSVTKETRRLIRIYKKYTNRITKQIGWPTRLE